MSDLARYFDEHRGLGVLATADEEGMVDAAIYARPRVADDGRVTLVMAHNRSYRNILQNPYAAYLFKEEGQGYRGRRLSLKMVHEERNPEEIDRYRRRRHPETFEEYKDRTLSLIIFEVLEERPLVGQGK